MRSPRPSSRNRGPISKGREERDGRGGQGWKGREVGGLYIRGGRKGTEPASKGDGREG